MSSHPSRLHCPLCHQIVRGYQKSTNHLKSHPIDQQKEIHVVEGSNRLTVSLPKSSELVQHVRTMNKRAKSRSPSPPPPPSFRPRWVRGNDSSKNMHVNQQLPPPPPLPSSYRVHSVSGNNDIKEVHTNQQLPPPQSSYRVNLVRGNDSGGSVRTNQQLPPPPSYRYGRGVHANQQQQMFQSTRRTHVRGPNLVALDLNEAPSESPRPQIKEIDFPILDRPDPSQLKFKPQIICDNETSGVDLSLRL